jgi:6-phosphogluconolactonase
MDSTKNFVGEQTRWRCFSTTELMLDAAVCLIAKLSAESITRNGRFNIVLTGGNTVRPLYERIRWINTVWPAWHIYWGDERCVPVSDQNRNSKMALDLWVSHVPRPPQQVHQIPTEGGLDAAVTHYQQMLRDAGVFDLVLLSLGEDGHVASLFPGQELGDNPETPAVQLVWGPKSVQLLPRLSLAAWRLSETRNMLIFAAGRSKEMAVEAWRNGQDLPPARLSAQCGIDVFVADIAELASM